MCTRAFFYPKTQEWRFDSSISSLSSLLFRAVNVLDVDQLFVQQMEEILDTLHYYMYRKFFNKTKTK